MNPRNRAPWLAAALCLSLAPAGAAAQTEPDVYDPYGSDTLLDEIEADTQRQLERQRGLGQGEFPSTQLDGEDTFGESLLDDLEGGDPLERPRFGQTDPLGTDPLNRTDPLGQSQLDPDVERFGESEIIGGGTGRVGQSQLLPSDRGVGTTQPRVGTSTIP